MGGVFTRVLAERDHLREVNAALLAALRGLIDVAEGTARDGYDWQALDAARAAIAEAAAQQGTPPEQTHEHMNARATKSTT